jgi:hypothetical protein
MSVTRPILSVAVLAAGAAARVALAVLALETDVAVSAAMATSEAAAANRMPFRRTLLELRPERREPVGQDVGA